VGHFFNLINNDFTMPDPLSPEDDELELEPIDPEILVQERARGKQKTDHAQAAVNEDLIRQAEELNDPISMEELKKLRFTMRHLMNVTGLLALVMTSCLLWGFGLGMFVVAMCALAAGWFFTMMRERRQHLAVDQLRHQLAEGIQREAGDDQTERVEPPAEPMELDFSFSWKELLIVCSAAAILLALVSLLGAGTLSIVLGMVALGGLIAQAVGVEAPPIVVLGWWVLLVLYLLLGLWHSTTADELASVHFVAITAGMKFCGLVQLKNVRSK
jgi:hypothetical protein